MFSHVTSLHWIDICCAVKMVLVAPISPLTFCHQINFNYLSVTFVLVSQPEFVQYMEGKRSFFQVEYFPFLTFMRFMCGLNLYKWNPSSPHLNTNRPKLLN